MRLNISYKKTIPIIFITIILIFFPFRFILGENENINAENNITSGNSAEDIIVYCDYYTWWNESKWNIENGSGKYKGLPDV